ncbi:phosphoglycerate kinase [Pacificibacter marinus]|uniref:Phosphoglycerate kinase n=1 Tax=Pacificibacter marinus TaxID=658057 RepID=A0A1Y5RV90_9RHOB|nr:phosphoglycerate kinase [Pacificibacter marinus]SEK38175.1 phosphoglycerate kinase [Pacificibacter marinus]SLN25929.1 Phosphoglycerate kinase [Pacificibacter marinus]
MAWKTLDDMDLGGKIVLTRVDINVPMENGRVTDATRIERIKPTIDDIIAKGGIPVMLAHFGRPKGEYVAELSLSHIMPAVTQTLGRDVTFIEKPTREALDALPAGSVVLVENTRFTAMETDNDPRMAQFLASLGDIFCNDAFSAAHRAHASTTGVAKLLPSCAGRLMQAELSALEAALARPERPVVAVVGGAKVSTKLELLGNLVRKVDYLVIGGGMANTFLAAQGIDVGKSLCEHDLADTARDILKKAGEAGCEIILPTDVVIAWEFAANTKHETVNVDACPADAMIFDAGPASVARINTVISEAKTLIMNGPLGVFELEPFGTGTFAMLAQIAAQTEAGKLISVAGGGDTVAAVNAAGAADKFTYISTAGGAFLEWMEGKVLPGVEALG